MSFDTAQLKSRLDACFHDEPTRRAYWDLFRRYVIARVSVVDFQEDALRLLGNNPEAISRHNQYLMGLLMNARAAQMQILSRDAAFEELQKVHTASQLANRPLTMVPLESVPQLDARVRARLEVIRQHCEMAAMDDACAPLVRSALEIYLKDVLLRLLMFSQGSSIRMDELINAVWADGYDLLGDEAGRHRERLLTTQIRLPRLMRPNSWLSRE